MLFVVALLNNYKSTTLVSVTHYSVIAGKTLYPGHIRNEKWGHPSSPSSLLFFSFPFLFPFTFPSPSYLLPLLWDQNSETD
jgi:hypothetical protein